MSTIDDNIKDIESKSAIRGISRGLGIAGLTAAAFFGAFDIILPKKLKAVQEAYAATSFNFNGFRFTSTGSPETGYELIWPKPWAKNQPITEDTIIEVHGKYFMITKGGKFVRNVQQNSVEVTRGNDGKVRVKTGYSLPSNTGNNINSGQTRVVERTNTVYVRPPEKENPYNSAKRKAIEDLLVEGFKEFYKKEGDYGLAEFTGACELGSETPENYEWLMKSYEKNKKNLDDTKKKEIEKLLTIGANKLFEAGAKADTRESLKTEAIAIALYKRAIIMAESVENFNRKRLGKFYANQIRFGRKGSYEPAKKLAKRAIELDPDNKTYQQGLKNIIESQKRFDN